MSVTTFPDEVEESVNITLPNLDNDAEVEQFKASLPKETKGVPTLIRRLDNYKTHMRLAGINRDKIHASIRFINGERLSRGSSLTNLTEDEKKERSLRMASRKYFNALLDQEHGDTLIRKQCNLFNLNFMDYETLEDAVDALVEKQVEMAKV